MLKVSLIVLVIVPVLAAGYLFFKGRSSQKGTAPGLVDGKLTACSNAPNCVSSDAVDPGHAVEPLEFDSAKLSPEAAWEKAQEAVKSLPGTRITTATENYLSAECTSQLFGFVDDLELHLRPDRSEIAIRSGSRVGHSDMGVNRKRVEILRMKFNSKSRDLTEPQEKPASP